MSTSMYNILCQFFILFGKFLPHKLVHCNNILYNCLVFHRVTEVYEITCDCFGVLQCSYIIIMQIISSLVLPQFEKDTYLIYRVCLYQSP